MSTARPSNGRSWAETPAAAMQRRDVRPWIAQRFMAPPSRAILLQGGWGWALGKVDLGGILRRRRGALPRRRGMGEVITERGKDANRAAIDALESALGAQFQARSKKKDFDRSVE